jgi:hypothetical protein
MRTPSPFRFRWGKDRRGGCYLGLRLFGREVGPFDSYHYYGFPFILRTFSSFTPCPTPCYREGYHYIRPLVAHIPRASPFCRCLPFHDRVPPRIPPPAHSASPIRFQRTPPFPLRLHPDDVLRDTTPVLFLRHSLYSIALSVRCVYIFHFFSRPNFRLRPFSCVYCEIKSKSTTPHVQLDQPSWDVCAGELRCVVASIGRKYVKRSTYGGDLGSPRAPGTPLVVLRTECGWSTRT